MVKTRCTFFVSLCFFQRFQNLFGCNKLITINFLGNHKIEYFSLIIDDQVRFEPKELSNGAWSFVCHAFKTLVGVFTADMASLP